MGDSSDSPESCDDPGGGSFRPGDVRAAQTPKQVR